MEKVNTLYSKSVLELKTILDGLELSTRGKKIELINRILEWGYRPQKIQKRNRKAA